MPFFSLPRTNPVGLALSAELIALFGTFLHLVARRGKWQSLLVGSLCQLLGVGVVAPVYMALVWSGQTKRTNARTTLHGAATSILVGFLLPTVWMLLSPGEKSIALWQPVPVYIFAVHVLTDVCPAILVPEMRWKRHVSKLIYSGFFLLHVYAIYLCVWQPAVSSDKLSSRDAELRVYATRFIAIDLAGVGVALLWAASNTLSDAVTSLLLGPGSIWKRLLA
ncbi:hypothetical protein HDU85_003595 [Gaertneriomyces sp. JEL0708]|nr:hypothetical protein HDU85_003595 [Gaertneriomyces sp. JEL0708]